MSAVVGYAPDGADAWLVFQMRPGSYNEETLIEFLGELHDHLCARPEPGRNDLGQPKGQRTGQPLP